MGCCFGLNGPTRTAVVKIAQTSAARARQVELTAERAGDDRGKRYNRRYLDGDCNCTVAVAAAASGFLTTLTTSLAGLSLALPTPSPTAIV